jgi:hypothetical protein
LGTNTSIVAAIPRRKRGVLTVALALGEPDRKPPLGRLEPRLELSVELSDLLAEPGVLEGE